LVILSLFLKKKKKKKRKKKKKNIKKKGGGKEIGGGSSHPHGRSGGGQTTPMAKGVVRPPPKAQKKKKKRKMGFGLLGGGFVHPKPGGWSGHPKPAFWGGRIHPQVRTTPKRPKPIFRFFFFLGFWEWPDHPLGHGGGSTTPRPAVGVAPATPFLAKSHPRFLSSPFFFFNIFFFFSFFKKKKMIKWPKRCRFETQNSVVLELKMT
jgi:hypothetical protein